ncbi:cytochrome c-type biogenesis protein CcmH [Ferrimonas sediminum]|uniref:Formate-dependent nitrite reductase complex subunit n=1 Tax=Ferrimonas sediminum TaxID=718193 RepID=A0A1G9B6H7_9GAMM|nr:heme lyase NrfEFG subunit NrfF [Ferrimonas sediminum]SDK35166.1 cytochrome c-type biogenesis protein CcmH [Ferrimonas sediminum]
MRALLKALSTFACLALFAGLAHATPIDTYEFKNDQNKERGIQLANELRCPQCQNQNLIDSNSPVARDLRLQVYAMVDEGKSDDEIVKFMTDRYGDFVRYRPAFDSRTLVLWLGPVAFAAFGIGIGLFFIRGQRQRNKKAPAAISEAERQRLAQMLKDNQD